MLTPRVLATLLALLGLVPVYAYFGGPVTYFTLSLGCVVLIAASLYLSFGPAEAGQEQHADTR